jgi:hypothetical protein
MLKCVWTSSEMNGSQVIGRVVYLLGEKHEKPRKPEAARKEPPDSRKPYELPPPPSVPEPSQSPEASAEQY